METSNLLHRTFGACAIAVLFGVLPMQALADTEPVGTAFTYQGRLTQAGEPVGGTVNLVFRLFEAPLGGSPLPDAVLVANDFPMGDDGVFTIDLDFGDHFTGASRWLEVDVNGTTLTPRQPIMPSPYAMVATTAANVPAKAVVGNFGGITGVGTLDSLNVSGNTGIGVSPYPTWRLAIETPPAESVSGMFVHQRNPNHGTVGVLSIAEGTNGAGVQGIAASQTGGGYGVLGISQADSGFGVWGLASHSTGTNYGVFAQTHSPDGFAGYFAGPAGSKNYFQQRVGIGTTDPQYGLHVNGSIFAETTWWAIRGHRTGTSGTFPGVWGLTESASSPSTGVRGEANHPSPGANVAGVTGINHGTTSNGHGVRGVHSGGGNGVEGLSVSGTGVRGISQSSSGYGGVFGDQSGPGRGILVNTQAHMLDRVGIGSTNPNSMLQVNGAAGTNPMRVQNSGVTRLLVHDNGNVMVGSATTPQDTLHVAGTTRTNVLRIMGGSDLAERFDVADLEDLTPQPGMVVCMDPANPGKLIPSTRAYDRTVAGVISGANGINSGMIMGQEGSEADGAYPVALTGRVYVMVDGAIEVGDLLTTSNTPGHAMRVNDYARAQGAIIGKAMSPLAAGEKGMVLVLVSLQ